ncbi:MAG: transglutaminase domain-containing protein, partial [Lachnospiraceae bacterium]|nr:transglutaminase domain-containing protein [Lachnospiraceae bacterium]
TGENPKVKLQITGPDDVLYTYDLDSGGRADVFPLSAGNGTYEINVYENVQKKQYSLALSAEVSVTLRDPFLPFLYPNQYVVFDENTEAVQLGETLAAPANEDLDVVSNVYNYIIRHVTYDTEKAETVPYGYLPSVDETLSTGKGICLDYASLMTAILRSQQIPTRMEIGYAGQAYHAWLSCYIQDVGWVNGLIEFDGEHWSLMDPTFAASNSSDFLESFIGDGDNYVLKFIY